MPESSRRDLKFEKLDDVVHDANSLLKSGYSTLGQWNLAQVCGHIDNWLGYAIDGFPPAPLPIRIMLGLMRVTSGKRMLRKVLESGFPEGGPTMPTSVPVANASSDEQAVANLRSTIERFERFDGPFHASPLYGELDKETLTRLHLVHAAHHLGFLEPNA